MSWVWDGGALAASAIYAFSTVWPAKGLHDWLVPGAIFRLDEQGIALTFDDGPHPERTPRVLDLLASHEAKATFFLVGKNVRSHPGLARRIVEEGHAIATHSDAHRWLPALSTGALGADLRRACASVEDAVGRPVSLVRPPYGHRDFRFNAVARRLGLTPVFWTIDTLDYLGVGERRVAARARRARPGDIVLLHDGNPFARGTVGALSRVCADVAARGLRMVAIPEPAAQPATLPVAS